jgi:ribonuclease P protein component
MNGRAQARLKVESFMLAVKPNRLNFNRLGVVTTKKVGKAVVRNRFKRIAREFFRQNHSSWPQGFDLLFIALQDKDPFQKGLFDQAQSKVMDFMVSTARKFSTLWPDPDNLSLG